MSSKDEGDYVLVVHADATKALSDECEKLEAEIKLALAQPGKDGTAAVVVAKQQFAHNVLNAANNTSLAGVGGGGPNFSPAVAKNNEVLATRKQMTMIGAMLRGLEGRLEMLIDTNAAQEIRDQLTAIKVTLALYGFCDTRAVAHDGRVVERAEAIVSAAAELVLLEASKRADPVFTQDDIDRAIEASERQKQRPYEGSRRVTQGIFDEPEYMKRGQDGTD